MSNRRWLIALGVLLLASPASPARGQEDEEPPVGPARAIEIGGHGGFIRFDGEGGYKPGYGGRVTFRLRNGLGVGASATFSRQPFDIADTIEKADAAFYSADFSYMFKSVERANFFAQAGVGAAQFDPPETHEALGKDRTTELLIPVGLGLLWFNHPGDPWWAIRADVRDNIVFLNGDADLGTDDSIANDWEISVGLSLLLGAYD